MIGDVAIDARTYTHAAFGDRRVVRLVASPLGAAEDLALEFLGLQLSKVDEGVTRGRRQALGFPGWALANDPANGAYALGVVKDMERLARLARSRPADARDGFEKLGDQLARTVPHFLPTFYEQVGRTYIEAEQPNQAASMFGRAREAERVYNLEVDEDRRRDVFVEFALAGALSSKAIDDFGDQLVVSRPPADAYATYRELCVQRTLGGIPPSSRMSERLNKMASAAGLDVNYEAKSLLMQVIDAAATARAAAGFWKAYRAAVLELARESTSFRGKLLNLFPSPQPAATGFGDWWLELLARSGATDALCAPRGNVDPETEPVGGPAAWLTRAAAQHNQGYRSEVPTGLQSLVERMAERLRSDGVAVDLVGPQAWSANLDLLDTAVAAGIPLVPPPRRHGLLRLNGATGRHLPKRELAHIATDAVFGPALASSLETDLTFGHAHADHLPRGSGVQHLLRGWLDRRAELLETGGLPQIEAVLASLEKSTSERTLALNPAARERLVGADLSAALARTLRAGIVDEFGWPALEEARAQLHPAANRDVAVYESWPNLVLSDNHKAVVVGPEGILLEHDLRLQSRSGVAVSDPALYYVGGQLLVAWYDPSSRSTRAYWSSQPGQVFDATTRQGGHAVQRASFEVAGSGRTFGGRAVHPGDSNVPEPLHLLTDGTTFWRLESGTALREFDPESGRAGRLSLPPLLDSLSHAGVMLAPAACSLLPAVPGVTDSPLGEADGLLGWAVGRTDQTVVGQRIDGAEFRGHLNQIGVTPEGRQASGLPVALVDVPFGSAPRPLSVFSQVLAWWSADGELELFRAQTGKPSDMARGSPFVLSPLFWHCLRPRDPNGSRALRCVSDATVRQLFESACSDPPTTQELVRKLLPEVTHPRLREGMVGVCAVAAGLAHRRDSIKVLQVQAVAPSPVATGADVDDQQLRAALAGLFTERGYSAGFAGRSQMLHQIGVLSAIASGAQMPASLPESPMPWPQLLGCLGAVAFRAVNPAMSEADREAALRFLEILSATPFAAPADQLRIVEVVDRDPITGPTALTTRILRKEARRLFVERGYHAWLFSLLDFDHATRRARRLLVEISPEGNFELPKEFELASDAPAQSTWDADRLRKFVKLARERGPLVWQPELVARLASQTGLSGAEATMLLAGLPGLRSYRRVFLSTETRQMVGLTPRDASAALDAMNRIDVRTVRSLLEAAIPDDLDALWTPEGLDERLARAWIARFGQRVAVPDELVRQLRTSIKPALPLTDLLAACAEPETSPYLNRDGRWALGSSAGGFWSVQPIADHSAGVFDGRVLTSVALVYPWLFAYLPVGDPMRAQLPAILEHARQRLANRELLLGPSWHRDFSADPSFFQSWPGAPYRTPGGEVVSDSRDVGVLVIVRRLAAEYTYAQSVLRPARVMDPSSSTLVPLMGAQTPAYAAARFLLGEGAAAMADRVRHSPVPVGSYEANPLLSAPDLVQDVAASVELEPSAAAVYLQLLTLAEPTTRNLAVWNGLRPKQLSGVLDVLVDRGFAVRAKRSRAGRDVFLPGPWADLKSPNLPIESWKLALYEGAPIEGRVLPLRPLHELFAAAWQRIQAGDSPAFDAVPAR